MAKKETNKVMSPAHCKFCEHYSEYSNATQAYLFAFPGTKYGSAKTLGSALLTNVDIKERIEQLKEEFECQFRQDKDRTIRDLLVSAEEAKKLGEWATYAKLRDMVARISKFYETKVDITSGGEKISINLNLGDDDETDKD